MLLTLNSPEDSFHVFGGLAVLSVLLLAVVDGRTRPAVVEAVAVPDLIVFPPGHEILQDQLNRLEISNLTANLLERLGLLIDGVHLPVLVGGCALEV